MSDELEFLKFKIEGEGLEYTLRYGSSPDSIPDLPEEVEDLWRRFREISDKIEELLGVEDE